MWVEYNILNVGRTNFGDSYIIIVVIMQFLL